MRQKKEHPLKTFFLKMIIVFAIIYIVASLLINQTLVRLQNFVYDNEFMNNPLKKIEKELHRSANPENRLPEEKKKEIAKSLKIIFDEEIKPIINYMNSSDNEQN